MDLNFAFQLLNFFSDIWIQVRKEIGYFEALDFYGKGLSSLLMKGLVNFRKGALSQTCIVKGIIIYFKILDF